MDLEDKVNDEIAICCHVAATTNVESKGQKQPAKDFQTMTDNSKHKIEINGDGNNVSRGVSGKDLVKIISWVVIGFVAISAITLLFKDASAGENSSVNNEKTASSSVGGSK